MPASRSRCATPATRSTSPTRATISSGGRPRSSMPTASPTRAPTAARRSAIACAPCAAPRGATPLLDLRYAQYSPRGLLQVVADGRNPSGALSNAAVFGYDGLGRLTASDYAYNPADRSFAYDGLGNLTRNGDRQVRFDNAARPHQMTSVVVGATTTAIAHDANGNRIGKTGQQYTYDAFDRLARADVGANAMRFLYDYQGRQVASVREGAPGFVTRFYDAVARSGGRLRDQVVRARVGAHRLGGEQLHRLGDRVARQRPGLRRRPRGSPTRACSSILGREAQWVARRAAAHDRRDARRAAGPPAPPGGGHRRAARARHRAGAALRGRHAAVAARRGAAAGAGGRRRLGHGHLPPPSRPPRLDPGDQRPQRRDRPADPLPAVRRGARALGCERHADRRFGDRRSGASSPASRARSRSGLEYAGARFYDPELGSFLTHDRAQPVRQSRTATAAAIRSTGPIRTATSSSPCSPSSSPARLPRRRSTPSSPPPRDCR